MRDTIDNAISNKTFIFSLHDNEIGPNRSLVAPSNGNYTKSNAPAILAKQQSW